MGISGLDQDGFIQAEASKDKILPEYQRAIDESITELKKTLPNIIHSVYVYGSVAREDAIRGKSDIDLLVVFHRPLSHLEREALSELQKRLSAQYKYLARGVGIADANCTYEDIIAVENEYGWGAFLKIFCCCVDGADLTKRFGNFKISPELASGINGDVASAVDAAIKNLSNAKSGGEVANTAMKIACKLIRTCYMMVMTRAGIWTTDLNEQAQIFAHYFPDKASMAAALKNWIEKPPNNKSVVLKILHEDTKWIIENFETEAKATL